MKISVYVKLLLLFLLAIVFPNPSVAFPNEPINDFNGIVWGTESSSGLHLIRRGDLDDYYDRDSDKKSYLGVPTESLLYVFEMGIFFQVEITFDSSENVKAILKQLESRFGAGEVVKSGVGESHVRWSGEDILLEFISNRADHASVTLTSKGAEEIIMNSIDAADDFLREEEERKNKEALDMLKF